MANHRRINLWVLAALILIGAVTWGTIQVVAQVSTRATRIVVPYTEYLWWLLDWETNKVACQFAVEHEGLPTADEVRTGCNDAGVYLRWLNTPPCNLSRKKTTTNCDGLYLHLASITPKKKEVVVELPTPVVWVTLEGCNPTPPDNLCKNIPTLVLTGEEPLPNEQITAIKGTYDGVPFNCQSSVCKLPLHPSPIQGSLIEFSADSSFGDSSEVYTAQVRVLDTGVPATPNAGGWYVDVISSQWQGETIVTCARIWQAFPPIGGPPDWLSTPEASPSLASGEPYYYLAGRLISQGLVDVTGCPAGGLLPNGYADACGLERARPMVAEWQNQFDERLVEVAQSTGIPAQLMKNLFAQESQFWPGIYRVPFEFGLGQITEKGADSILLWNSAFYEQFCPLVLAEETCEQGYLKLTEYQRTILRGALAFQANADCPTCQSGINLANASFSVELFANTLKASCAQIDQLIFTATQRTSGSVATYEDLWRMTVANYHAGPGCVSYAIHLAWQNTGRLTWQDVATQFTVPCQGVIPYVNEISAGD